MPLYEYNCKNCSKTCEILQKLSETQAVTCPHCGQDELQRKISASRFQLKGQGWYETDFKNKNKPAVKQEGENKTTEAAEKTATSVEKTPPKEENK